MILFDANPHSKVYKKALRRARRILQLREISKKGPRPITKVDFSRARSRAEGVLWMHEGMFLNLDEVMKNTPEHFAQGYFAVTLTLDREHSKYVANEKVRYDQMLRELSRRLRSEDGSIDYVRTVDLHQDGWPHMHVFMLVRNDQELATALGFQSWWTKNHGNMDIKPLRSRQDAQRWLAYCLKDRPWHSMVPQDRGLDAVSYGRELAMVVAAKQPKVTETNIVVREAGKQLLRKEAYPKFIVADGVVRYLDSEETGIGVRHVDDINGRTPASKDIVTVAYKGAMSVYTRWVKSAVRTINTAPYKQAMIDRLTESGVLEAFLHIAGVGGYMRAISWLHSTATGIDPKFAWKTIGSLQRCGYECGMKIKTTAGTQVEWDLDLLRMIGVCALSPDEIGRRIEATFVA